MPTAAQIKYAEKMTPEEKAAEAKQKYLLNQKKRYDKNMKEGTEYTLNEKCMLKHGLTIKDFGEEIEQYVIKYKEEKQKIRDDKKAAYEAKKKAEVEYIAELLDQPDSDEGMLLVASDSIPADPVEEVKESEPVDELKNIIDQKISSQYPKLIQKWHDQAVDSTYQFVTDDSGEDFLEWFEKRKNKLKVSLKTAQNFVLNEYFDYLHLYCRESIFGNHSDYTGESIHRWFAKRVMEYAESRKEFIDKLNNSEPVSEPVPEPQPEPEPEIDDNEDEEELIDNRPSKKMDDLIKSLTPKEKMMMMHRLNYEYELNHFGYDITEYFAQPKQETVDIVVDTVNEYIPDNTTVEAEPEPKKTKITKFTMYDVVKFYSDYNLARVSEKQCKIYLSFINRDPYKFETSDDLTEEFLNNLPKYSTSSTWYVAMSGYINKTNQKEAYPKLYDTLQIHLDAIKVQSTDRADERVRNETLKITAEQFDTMVDEMTNLCFSRPVSDNVKNIVKIVTQSKLVLRTVLFRLYRITKSRNDFFKIKLVKGDLPDDIIENYINLETSEYHMRHFKNCNVFNDKKTKQYVYKIDGVTMQMIMNRIGYGEYLINDTSDTTLRFIRDSVKEFYGIEKCTVKDIRNAYATQIELMDLKKSERDKLHSEMDHSGDIARNHYVRQT